MGMLLKLLPLLKFLAPAGKAAASGASRGGGWGKWLGLLGIGAEILDQTENDGAGTAALLEKGADLLGGVGLSSITGLANRLFNDMEEDGLYAAVPIVAALTAGSSDGIVDGVLKSAFMAAITWLGVGLAKQHGFGLPGIKNLFTAASERPRQTTVTMPRPLAQAMAPG